MKNETKAFFVASSEVSGSSKAIVRQYLRERGVKLAEYQANRDYDNEKILKDSDYLIVLPKQGFDTNQRVVIGKGIWMYIQEFRKTHNKENIIIITNISSSKEIVVEGLDDIIYFADGDYRKYGWLYTDRQEEFLDIYMGIEESNSEQFTEAVESLKAQAREFRNGWVDILTGPTIVDINDSAISINCIEYLGDTQAYLLIG